MVVRCVQGGLCNLEKHDATDKRVVGVGLRSLMVCQEHDMSSRMRMMEFAAGFIMTNVTRRCITPPAS
jgi:hypothetical protein